MSKFSTSPFSQQKRIDGINKIIAVGAGKGGVGKSSVAVNLAMSLAALGKRVGLLDSDIYGPSIPKMMGLTNFQPNLTADKRIEPPVGHGVRTMSIGYLIEEDKAVIWRGPMLFKAIEQFLKDVNWGQLDYLLVDLPPGTGDVALSLTQKVPLDGVVVVSTPQDMALIDVKRCVNMFETVKVPILGMIENMATYDCPHCHKESELFQPGELHQYCDKMKIPVLAQVPFTPLLNRAAEKGVPFVIDNADSATGLAFQAAARKLVQASS